MNCVINCFGFTLKATCYLSDGTRIEINSLNSEEIEKVIKAMGITKLTLMGPTSFTAKIGEEVRKVSDVEIYLMGATYE